MPAEPNTMVSPDVKRLRSPAHPVFSLAKAVDSARLLFATVRKHDVHVESAIQILGYTSSSGFPMRAISALDQFGLLEQSGSKGERKVKLTEIARDIIELPESDPRWSSALKTAALAPRIYSDLWERFGPFLPDDAALRSYLLRDRDFSPDGAKVVIEGFRESLAYAKLFEGDKISPVAEVPSNFVPPPSPELANSVALQPSNHEDFSPPEKQRMAVVLPKPLSHQELPIFLGDGLFARIPCPLSEENFEILIDTLNLWKKKLVLSQ